MKVRKKLWCALFFTFLFLGITGVYAVETHVAIRTSGNFDNVQTRSLSSVPTVSMVGSTLIVENPSKNCDITISIIDNEGYAVYEQTFPASATDYITIPLGSFPSGRFTITLRNPSGGYLYGSFTI